VENFCPNFKTLSATGLACGKLLGLGMDGKKRGSRGRAHPIHLYCFSVRNAAKADRGMWELRKGVPQAGATAHFTSPVCI
jgi:hypothetical protein